MATNTTKDQSLKPQPVVPSWNPASLLQPKRNVDVTPKPTTATSLPIQSPPRQSAINTSHQHAEKPPIFHFDSATDSRPDDPPPESSPAADPDLQNPVVVGAWVERLNNVQSRSQLPPPKRRKTADDTLLPVTKGHAATPFRPAGHILGAYVKEKHNPAGNHHPPASASTVDLTDGADDDVPLSGDPKDGEVCYGMIKSGLNCVRVPSPKPGMQSLWGPAYQPGIKIILKRQSGDRSLRIHACDHTRQMIGLVEPTSAAALCPLLDSNIRLRTDCRIPPHLKQSGEEPGQPTSRCYPLDIVIYGPQRYASSVGSLLLKYQLKLLAPHMVQRGIRVDNPHKAEYRPPPPKAHSTDLPAMPHPPLVSRTVEEIRSEVMGVFDSLIRNEDLAEMEPDSSVLTPLLTHQKQGLYFMTMRERPMQELAKDKAMVSFWQTRTTGTSGQRLYLNVITGQRQKEAPPETRGGILADMMGLGKTLSILSLVTSTAADARRWESLEPVQRPPLRTAGEKKPPASEARPSQQPCFDPAPVTRQSRATLIVCPLSTVTNWEEQIRQHLRPDSLSYHVYHGPNRIKDAAKLAAFDIVITTYGSVSNELNSRRKGKGGSYPLEEVGWFRIVLDEAHMIREQSTLQFKAMCRLQAERRWAVTGTPVQNRLDDLAALLSFLRLSPFDDRAKFNRYIVEPFKLCDPEIVPRLRVLVDTITLRRLKDKIDLPPREDRVVRLDFSPEEKAVYDVFARNAQDRVTALAGSNIGRALGGNTYIHILKAILRLRLLCAHGKELLNEEDLSVLRGISADMAIELDDDDGADGSGGGLGLSHQKALEMFALMQETNNDACIECSKKLGLGDGQNLETEGQEDVLGYMTPCFHVVCRSCLGIFRERAQAGLEPGQSSGPCPVCHARVRLALVELRQEEVETEHGGAAKTAKTTRQAARKRIDEERYEGPHTKTRALIEDLLKSRAESEAEPSEPPYKSVVFSGWTSHLDLIELALRAAGISFGRLDGSMPRSARTAVMDSFRDDDGVEVLLVSIMAGGLGLNLTAANKVYVMEPQYNPAAEAQAIDRVHRLGQKRPVRTVRYIMRHSFEERMLELQEKKKKLASLSMDGQSRTLDKTEAARQKLMDLRSLFK